jgi:lipooligosaccharide transport system permease protein
MARPTFAGAVRVATWEWMLYRRMWATNLLSSFLQPLLYILGLGVGVGTLVDRNTSAMSTLGAPSYVAFVAPGLVITTGMSLASLDSMWPVMGSLKWNRAYFGIAATPLEAVDIVCGHALKMAARCVAACGLVALALALFPDTRSWGLIPTVVIAALVGIAFAMPVMAVSVKAEHDGVFANLNRFVVIPLFLFGGAFYPLSKLPTVVQWIARATPLWHGTTVARQFTFGAVNWLEVCGHLGYMVVWAVAGTVVATRRLRRKLYP